MSGVSLKNVVKRYGDVQVIHGVDLHIEDGELCVFVGPSGCGKSTLMRMIAGLEETTEGEIHIGSRDVTRVDPAARGVAMVFQTYALYPHMTVEENMGFGLKMTGHPASEIKGKVAEASRILKLDEYLKRKPAALSGGQRQRVGICRALIQNPKLLLVDEPSLGLSPIYVKQNFAIIQRIRERGVTVFLVEQNAHHALRLAHRGYVLANGRVVLSGTGDELLANREVRAAYLEGGR